VLDKKTYAIIRSKVENNLDTNPYMYVKKDDNNIWLRTPFNSIYDLVLNFFADYSAESGATYYNPLFAFQSTQLLDINTVYTFAQSWVGTEYHSTTDDLAPMRYNGTYIGGGHGANIVKKITVTSHDKVTADLGSIWADADSKQWTLVRVVDATHLQFLADLTTGENGNWVGDTTMGASPLTHVSGATNTGDIAFSASATDQLLPGVKNVSQRFLVDGQVSIVDDAVYQCAFFDIIQEYQIVDPRTLLTYMKANIGKTIIEANADSSVTADCTIVSRYRFSPNGSCVVYHEASAVNYLASVYWGGLQSAKLAYDTGKLIEYIPRVKSFTGSVKTWDFAATEEIQGDFEEISLGSAKWNDTNKPPFRYAQIVQTAEGVPVIGFSAGFSLSKLDTVDTTRKTRVSPEAFNIYTTRKTYMHETYYNALIAGTTHKHLAYRVYFDPNNISSATVYQCHQEGNELIIDVDFHITVDHICMPVPAGWYGKAITTLDSNGTITIHNNTVGLDGIVVSVTSYGGATLKIS